MDDPFTPAEAVLLETEAMLRGTAGAHQLATELGDKGEMPPEIVEQQIDIVTPAITRLALMAARTRELAAAGKPREAIVAFGGLRNVRRYLGDAVAEELTYQLRTIEAFAQEQHDHSS